MGGISVAGRGWGHTSGSPEPRTSPRGYRVGTGEQWERKLEQEGGSGAGRRRAGAGPRAPPSEPSPGWGPRGVLGAVGCAETTWCVVPVAPARWGQGPRGGSLRRPRLAHLRFPSTRRAPACGRGLPSTNGPLSGTVCVRGRRPQVLVRIGQQTGGAVARGEWRPQRPRAQKPLLRTRCPPRGGEGCTEPLAPTLQMTLSPACTSSRTHPSPPCRGLSHPALPRPAGCLRVAAASSSEPQFPLLPWARHNRLFSESPSSVALGPQDFMKPCRCLLSPGVLGV